MESALPPTSASTTLLAPEELFNPPTAPSLVARSELTPEEAQRARQRARKVKQSRNRKLGDMAELYGKKKGAKAEKEEALKNLVKGGKGVTVVGKGDKEAGKASGRMARGSSCRGQGARHVEKRWFLHSCRAYGVSRRILCMQSMLMQKNSSAGISDGEEIVVWI
jgi:U3 small nucleolar RNA-associated protein MPP10